jgi:hypothetical protein
MTIAIRAGDVGELLAIVESLAGRSLQYAYRRLIELAYQWEEGPFRDSFLAEIEAIYAGRGPDTTPDATKLER